MLLAASGAASAEPFFTDVHVNGYLRGWASFNLQDVNDTAQNDRGDLSMLRGSLLVDTQATTGPVKWHAIFRADREYQTKYIERLENLTKTKTPGGPGSHVMDEYNAVNLREFYADIDLNSRVKMRLGKQQVVWGESDFFRGLDLIQGYDYRWRSFLEPENEELRKPLILANVMVQVPEVDGALQVVVRPGLDRARDIGNTYDLYGGRWTPQTFKGADFTNKNVTMSYDYHHPSGNVDDVTGGLRWTGRFGSVSYGLAYLKTFNPDPIVNPGPASGGVPYQKTATSPFGNWIFPEINLVGVTGSVPVNAINSVVSTEIVYIKDAPYNYGLMTPTSKYLPSPYGSSSTIPGFGGIIKKKTVSTMLRIDTPINLKETMGTSADSFLSFQLFDKWILNYHKSDEIVDLTGYNAPKAEHSTIVTAILAMNYAGNTINPTLAAGMDIWNKGGFLIPSVEFVRGDNWRIRVEADLFFSASKRQSSLGSLSGLSEDKTHLFGAFATSDQLVVRVTRQF
jgi:hypothetical protein